MSKISIRFEGICTHICNPFPQEGVPHRVVLVKATREFPPHDARLIIPSAAALEAEVRAFAAGPRMTYEGEFADNYHVGLRGVTLSIANPHRGQHYRQDETFLCGMPRLSVVAGMWLGEPDPSVTCARNTDTAWMYFDVSAGMWTAGLVYEGAVAAEVACETEDDPVLRADPWPDAQGRHLSTSLKIADGKTLTVQYGGATRDDKHDFGIQFRVATNQPPPGTTLDKTPHCLLRRRLRDLVPPAPALSIGPGCSNSLFP
jgi:hypothetical protein